jgi:hypothetical protein
VPEPGCARERGVKSHFSTFPWEPRGMLLVHRTNGRRSHPLPHGMNGTACGGLLFRASCTSPPCLHIIFWEFSDSHPHAAVAWPRAVRRPIHADLFFPHAPFIPVPQSGPDGPRGYDPIYRLGERSRVQGRGLPRGLAERSGVKLTVTVQVPSSRLLLTLR